MLHLGSIRGTSIDVDFSFFILIFLFVVLNYRADQGIHFALLWIPILFLSVLIHELAHAAMIGAFGFGSSQIVLGGMGGVTMNARRAAPWQDMFISLAGPVSSFALYFLANWLGDSFEVMNRDRMLRELLPRLAWANLVWAFFNLIPTPPLDGGHATREFLRTIASERTAFIIATWIAIVAGAAIAIYFFKQKNFFIALYIGWFTYSAFQRWQ